MEKLIAIMENFGIAANNASEAFQKFSSLIPPFTEDDILRVKANPSLSMVEKIRIVRNMRKQMMRRKE